MASVVEDDCRADIGGDEQRVDEMATADQDVLFRLLLLPLWIAIYITGGKTFHVYVNANTARSSANGRTAPSRSLLRWWRRSR